MINESHYDWRHRYFATLLLDSLYRLGYRFLALEALGYDSNLGLRGFPVIQTGFYTKEPYMGELIRNALRMGFTLVSYEDTTATYEGKFTSLMQKREYMQAHNLFQQFRKNPKGKWLVLAGYGHINKFQLTLRGDSSMAMYFKQMSGIDPFCIDQSRYCDLLTEPTTIQKLSTGYYSLNASQIADNVLSKQCDLYIINNLKEQPYEPESRYSSGYRQFEISLTSEKIERELGNCVVMIFYTSEITREDNCIPIYVRRLIDKKQTKFIAFLPDNDYTVIVKNETGDILENKDIRRKEKKSE
ncbi:MAG: hypothetical protein QM763_23975 [Agriterribacter sp.]